MHDGDTISASLGYAVLEDVHADMMRDATSADRRDLAIFRANSREYSHMELIKLREAQALLLKQNATLKRKRVLDRDDAVLDFPTSADTVDGAGTGKSRGAKYANAEKARALSIGLGKNLHLFYNTKNCFTKGEFGTTPNQCAQCIGAYITNTECPRLNHDGAKAMRGRPNSGRVLVSQEELRKRFSNYDLPSFMRKFCE
jgi:hypothetical protein